MARNTAEIQRLNADLKRVRDAIAAIERGSQSYSIGDMQYSKATIFRLYEREADLEVKIKKLENKRSPVVGVNFSGFPR